MTVSPRWQPKRATVGLAAITLPNRGWLLLMLGILVLSVALRLYRIEVPVLWLDEAFSVKLSSMAPGQILLHTGRDVHPPLYYLLLHYWIAAFGDGLLAVRGFSVLAGVLSVLLAMAIALRLANPRAAVITGLFMALLPITVRYSQEVRMYSLLGMWLLAATLLLMMWVQAQHRRRYLLIYAVLLTAALYTHYFAVLCAAAHWLYLLPMRNGRGQRLVRSPDWWLCNVAIALAFLPWLPQLNEQMTRSSGALNWIAPVSGNTLPSALWQFMALQPGTEHGWPVFWLLPVAVAALCMAAVKHDKLPAKPRLLILLFFCLPLLTAWLASYALPVFMPRYLLFSAAGLAILLAVTVDGIARRSPVGAAVLVILCVSLQSAGLGRLYQGKVELNGKTVWGRIKVASLLDQVNAHWRDGDVMVVDSLFWYYSVEYYNKTGSEPRLYQYGQSGDNSGTSPTSYNWETLLYPRSEQIYVVDPRQLSAKSGRVWWIQGPASSRGANQLPPAWTLQARYIAGDIQALLFEVPPAAGHGGTSSAVDQAATSVCGSKLSARAICHMRE
ncbi:glycosyltransferase family 39 protein [Pseudomonas sp. KU43P]|uniref:glycosyltransferase family 39 protein n=1 Tax=Pseudomonas sp. KU43P TaxID=2487887 RepID=UPI0012A96DCA|nr:glycosyltransferase family 39 protein [Pseudomonas sp. KU43P]BBH47765.1 membrane protein [Pseudomonas sp. KU43P]